MASEVGGRLLELKVDEGDRVKPGDVGREARHARRRARACARAGGARTGRGAARLLLAGARPKTFARPKRRSSAAEADREAAEAELARRETSTCSGSRRCSPRNSGSRKQRDDAVTRRDVARERVAAAEERVRAPRAKSCRGCAPAPGARKSTPRARASRPPTPRSRRWEKALADATVTHRSPASSPRSSRRRRDRRAARAARGRRPISIMRGRTCSSTSRTCRGSARPAGHALHRRRRQRHRGHAQLHLLEGRVHAAQRADRGGPLEARLPGKVSVDNARACSRPACRSKRRFRLSQ